MQVQKIIVKIWRIYTMNEQVLLVSAWIHLKKVMPSKFRWDTFRIKPVMGF